jgi:hypothetical protein
MRPEQPFDNEKMFVYSCLSWFVAVLAGFASVYGIFYANYREASDRLAGLAQE